MGYPGHVRQRAVDLYDAGLALDDIARQVGVSKSSVSAWAHAAGLSRRRPHTDPATIDTAADQWLAGEPVDDIAMAHEVTTELIRFALLSSPTKAKDRTHMSFRNQFVASLILMLAVTACGGDASTDEATSPAETTSASAAAESTSAVEVAATEAAETEPEAPATSETVEGRTDFTFDEPFTVTNDVYELSVSEIRLATRAALGAAIEEEGGETADILEDDTETIIVLELTGTNNSDSVIEWFPGQSAIVIGSEQLESDFLLSELLAPTDGWQPGVSRDGSSVYQSTANTEDLVAGGELRMLIGNAMDEDFNELVPDEELTISWP